MRGKGWRVGRVLRYPHRGDGLCFEKVSWWLLSTQLAWWSWHEVEAMKSGGPRRAVTRTDHQKEQGECGSEGSKGQG